MSKAILVINMPTICSNCVLEQNGVINHKSYSYCGACGITTKRGHLLKDCPLKPMPSRMEVDYDTVSSAEVTEKVVAMGFNACIDAILGGEE